MANVFFITTMVVKEKNMVVKEKNISRLGRHIKGIHAVVGSKGKTWAVW